MKSPLSLTTMATALLLLCFAIAASPAHAECAGGVCGPRAFGGGSGWFGGYSAPRFSYSHYETPSYSTPSVSYSMPIVTGYSSSSSTSNGYTRDAEGWLIAPDGARVTALDGTPIGPTRQRIGATTVSATSSQTGSSDYGLNVLATHNRHREAIEKVWREMPEGSTLLEAVEKWVQTTPGAKLLDYREVYAQGTCNCGCEEQLKALEQRIVALEDRQPFYTPLPGAESSQAPAAKPAPRPTWQERMAKDGRPLPVTPPTVVAMR